MFKVIANIRIGLLHATYHRAIRRATAARKTQDIAKFKRYIYTAEDAWRKLVLIKEKYKL
jgi:hypothetical protein|tara:strand:- start:1131 stop:1310 length:180 start_codon:yes stop_codon:yes gene_type:complete